MRKQLKSFLPLILLIIVLALASSRGSHKEKSFQRARFLMGTLVEVTIFDEQSHSVLRAAVEDVFEEIGRLEQLLGRRQKKSDIWKVNQNPDRDVDVSPEVIDVMEAARGFEKVSGGAFNVGIGQLVALWDFDGDSSAPPADEEIKSLLASLRSGEVRADRQSGTVKVISGQAVDLGGIAKGYIIDRAASVLSARGIKNFIVNAGGDMRISGKKKGKSWRIGLQHPRKKGEVFAHIDVEDEATSIVTSGDYERFYLHEGKRYHHILDPSTGYPARGLISATIVAPDTMTADALCTAVFVLGREKGMELVSSMPGVEGVLMEDGEKVFISRGLEGKVVLR